MWDCVLNMVWTHVACLLTFVIATGAVTKIADDEIVTGFSIEAVAGGAATLPCDVSPPVPEDTVHLVIWYKDTVESPIYSIDARETSIEDGKHWSDPAVLGNRAQFKMVELPTRLTIQRIRESDAGMYRCRVDFKKSPTRNTKVNLTVIVPPERLSVLDEQGNHIQHYILGPYDEGVSVDITCIASGGRPLPRVTWWQESTLLDESYEILPERRVRNILHIDRLERRHLNTVFTCQASNNNFVAPISSAVTLDINLQPLWVRLLGENRPFSADQTYQVTCEVVGGRPFPIISWWKDSLSLRTTKESMSDDANITVSTLTFVPSVEDSGKVLTCRAAASHSTGAVTEDSWILNVFHLPLVSLELAGSVNESNVQEGVDVYLECNIQSNPWVYRVTWKHNGKTLFSNASAGTVISNQSLFLQSVTRSHAGTYTCIGSNQEGDGESNPLFLDVKYSNLSELFTKSEPVVIQTNIRYRRAALPDQKSKRRKKRREQLQQLHMDKRVKMRKMFLESLHHTDEGRLRLAETTKDQFNNSKWFKERRKRLTASNFGIVCNMRESTSCRNVVYNILYKPGVDNEYTRHGIEHEPIAKKKLYKKHGIKAEDSGLYVDKELPFLAASPDGLIGNDSILEVKCPFKASMFSSAFEAIRNGSLLYCYIEGNTIKLKENARFYYQIQGQLHITRRRRCYFVIYTNNWLHYEIIERNDEFWKGRMEEKLVRFYMECLLPEILEPQFVRRNDKKDIKDPDYIKQAQNLDRTVRNLHSPAVRLVDYTPTFLNYSEYIPTIE